MALFNYAAKEITLKVVYYGPGLCGKTTNLQRLHESMSSEKKGKLLSLSTESDRTLFFDFMPITLGKIKEFNIKFQLYTVPGQVRYNATRKLVLKGADSIVFVADSQTAMRDANIESFENMKENLIANNINPNDIPIVLQYNKRDLPSILSVEELNRDLNPSGEQIIEASALKGVGVEETFKTVTTRMLKYISKKHNVKIEAPEEPKAPPSFEEPVAAAVSAYEGKNILEEHGTDETIVKISIKEKESAETPSRESEIEKDILWTSLPEEPSMKEAASEWEPSPEEPSAPLEWGPAPEEREEKLEWPSPEEQPAPSETAVVAEEPVTTAVPIISPEAMNGTEFLKLILDELKESRKQQAEILSALKEMIRVFSEK